MDEPGQDRHVDSPWGWKDIPYPAYAHPHRRSRLLLGWFVATMLFVLILWALCPEGTMSPCTMVPIVGGLAVYLASTVAVNNRHAPQATLLAGSAVGRALLSEGDHVALTRAGIHKLVNDAERFDVMWKNEKPGDPTTPKKEDVKNLLWERQRESERALRDRQERHLRGEEIIPTDHSSKRDP